jgi:hypothetical protein
LLPRALLRGRDAEIAALALIQERAENAGGIEMREAAPVDGPVVADERDGMQVADNAVIFDGLVGDVSLRA